MVIPSSFIELGVYDKRRTESERHGSIQYNYGTIQSNYGEVYNLKSHANKKILGNQSGKNSGICPGRVLFFSFQGTATFKRLQKDLSCKSSFKFVFKLGLLLFHYTYFVLWKKILIKNIGKIVLVNMLGQ